MNKLLLLISILAYLNSCLTESDNWILISKSRSPNLAKYEAYADASVMELHVPKNTINASFKFVAGEQVLSIFGCKARNVSLHLKQGSQPIVNPDGAPYPVEFKNISRAKTYNIEFHTDNQDQYINITSPDPGSYFALVFLAYEDPRYRQISQQGLTPSCNAFVDASLYVKKIDTPTIVVDNQMVNVMSKLDSSRYFTFLSPDTIDNVILSVESTKFGSSTKNAILRVQAEKPPSENSFIVENNVTTSNSPSKFIFATEPLLWYYIEVKFQTTSGEVTEVSELNFNLRYVSNRKRRETFVAQAIGNTTLYNITVINKNYRSYKLTDVQPYTQYDLVKESTSRSFAFSHKLQPEMDYDMLVPLNVTSNEFSVLKFHLRKGADIGGTLQYILAFKPRINKKNRNMIEIEEEPKEHIIIGCIQRDSISVPTWPKYCVSNEISMLSPIILNSTTDNSTVLIPYPESGVWYASFKLFCGGCELCRCPEKCQEKYENCVVDCELKCSDTSTENCEVCAAQCSSSISSTDECSACNCNGPCQKNSSITCNSSVIYDIGSRPCYYGDCGKQGDCSLLISEGTAYSTCLCSNKYRGFDCSDGSLATPFSLVLIEFLLLVMSNIFFLPAAYIAFRREYYVETLSYVSVFLSSSFYHACDAGENIISFCVFRQSALQFSDFFSALLAIWLTLMAMADLPQVTLSLLQMGGAMVIAFCVTLSRYALWIFALPACIGITIICISWFMRYRKYRGRFIDRTYLRFKLPIGMAIVVIGLLIYGLLQTQSNYKYLHSLWHIIIATGVIFVLPKKDTFQALALF